MKTSLLVIFIPILFSCQNITNNNKAVLNSTEDLVSEYDYLNFDSIFINCKLKPFSSFEQLQRIFGDPDTIIKVAESMTEDDKSSIMNYGETKFYLLDNNQVRLSSLDLGGTQNKICYKTFSFDKSTDLNSLSKIFPKSFKNRDQITIDGEKITSLRFYTSNHLTDSQWIMLFSKTKLKFFDFYGADD